MKQKRLLWILGIILLVILLLFMFWYIGANPKIENISGEKTLFRTAQAQSFTVLSPQLWVEDFISLDVNDTSVIPQGISDDKPYFVIYPIDNPNIVTTKVMFFVNDLSLSGLSYQEYIDYVKEQWVTSGFEMIIDSNGDNWNEYLYNYVNQGNKIYEYKKFIYKDGVLLTAGATTSEDRFKEIDPIFNIILDSIKLR